MVHNLSECNLNLVILFSPGFISNDSASEIVFYGGRWGSSKSKNEPTERSQVSHYYSLSKLILTVTK